MCPISPVPLPRMLSYLQHIPSHAFPIFPHIYTHSLVPLLRILFKVEEAMAIAEQNTRHTNVQYLTVLLFLIFLCVGILELKQNLNSSSLSARFVALPRCTMHSFFLHTA